MERRPSKLQILLVEDKPTDAIVLQGLVQTGDAYECVIAASLTEALQQVQEKAFDAGLLDLHLGDSYGPSTVAEILRQAPNLPIVVVTGDMSPETEVAATAAGAAGFVTKNGLTSEDLQVEIRVAMARHSRLVVTRSATPPPPPFDNGPLTNPGFSIKDLEGDIAESVANRLSRELSKIPLFIQREVHPLAADVAEIKATLRVIQSTVDGHSRILTGGSTPEKGLLHRTVMTQEGFKACQASCVAAKAADETKEHAVVVERTKARSAVQIALITMLGAIVSAITSAYVAAHTVQPPPAAPAAPAAHVAAPPAR